MRRTVRYFLCLTLAAAATENGTTPEEIPQNAVCSNCDGQGVVCSQTKRPWISCCCGSCERGPDTRVTCPACKGVKGIVPK